MRLLLLFAAGIATLAPSVATAQTETGDVLGCELHVWPTGQINAVDKDNSFSIAGGAMVFSSSYERAEHVSRSLAEAISPEVQLGALRSFGIANEERFSGYSVIYHDGEVAPANYPQEWLNKDVGHGKRLSDSTSSCYVEMHVMFATYVDQPRKDTLHTIFMLRNFGANMETTNVAVDGGYNRTPDFEWEEQVQNSAARASLLASFNENIRKFFTRRKVKRMMRTIDGEE